MHESGLRLWIDCLLTLCLSLGALLWSAATLMHEKVCLRNIDAMKRDSRCSYHMPYGDLPGQVYTAQLTLFTVKAQQSSVKDVGQTPYSMAASMEEHP